MATKTAFCANCLADTDQVISVDLNGEILLTCACGRFIKLPAGTTPEEVNTFLVAHKEQNQGNVSIEASQDTVNAIADTP